MPKTRKSRPTLPIAFAFFGTCFLFEDSVEEILSLGFPVTIFSDSSDAIICLERQKELAQFHENAPYELACAGLYGNQFSDIFIPWPEEAVQQEVKQFNALEKEFGIKTSPIALARSSLTLDGFDGIFPILASAFETIFLFQQSAVYRDGTLNKVQIHFPSRFDLENPTSFCEKLVKKSLPVVLLADSSTLVSGEMMRVVAHQLSILQEKFPIQARLMSQLFRD